MQRVCFFLFFYMMERLPFPSIIKRSKLNKLVNDQVSKLLHPGQTNHFQTQMRGCAMYIIREFIYFLALIYVNLL